MIDYMAKYGEPPVETRVSSVLANMNAGIRFMDKITKTDNAHSINKGIYDTAKAYKDSLIVFNRIPQSEKFASIKEVINNGIEELDGINQIVNGAMNNGGLSQDDFNKIKNSFSNMSSDYNSIIFRASEGKYRVVSKHLNDGTAQPIIETSDKNKAVERSASLNTHYDNMDELGENSMPKRISVVVDDKGNIVG